MEHILFLRKQVTGARLGRQRVCVGAGAPEHVSQKTYKGVDLPIPGGLLVMESDCFSPATKKDAPRPSFSFDFCQYAKEEFP